MHQPRHIPFSFVASTVAAFARMRAFGRRVSSARPQHGWLGRHRWIELWNDQRGVVVSAELVLVVTVVVIGLLVGLTSLRDQMVQEFADLGAAIGALDHSYSFASIEDADGSVAGSVFVDNSDYCDAGDPPGAAALAIDFVAADAED